MVACLGVSAVHANLVALRNWIGAFPQDAVLLCEEWLQVQPEGTWVVGPDPGLAEFRVQASRCLKRVDETLRHVWKHLPIPGRVICLLENQNNRGLDDFEAEAVFGAWLEIEILRQVDRGKSHSRILVAGRLREDRVSLAFRLQAAGGWRKYATLWNLSLLERLEWFVGTIFMCSEEAYRLQARSDSPLAEILRRLLESRRISLGLWIPRHRTQLALNDLAAEVAPLLSLVKMHKPVKLVRFEELEPLHSPDRLTKALEQTDLRYDCSLTGNQLIHPSQGRNTRGAPYFSAGAYQPMSFDLRVPRGIWNPNGWIEIIPSPLESSAKNMNWPYFNSWRQGHRQKELPRLLDFERMESYFLKVTHSLSLNQAYHEYRVYNWPPPDPSPRCTLLDGGTLDRPLVVAALLRRLRPMAKGLGSRCRLVDQDALLTAALCEAEKRISLTRQHVLDVQIEEHGYLEQIGDTAPLRKDVADFTEFIPGCLGRTLEMGSGYGKLANTLAERAFQYVCVDLLPQMFGQVGRGVGYPGIVADVHALPFRPESFDAVVANNVLEHTYDPAVCLSEVRRVLRVGGKLYVLIPLDALNPQYSVRTHLWKADEAGVRHAVQAAGFTVARFEVIDLYAMGIPGSFPTCNGLVAKVEGVKLQPQLLAS